MTNHLAHISFYENHLASAQPVIANLLDKIKTLALELEPSQDWKQRKSLYWMSWLEQNDYDAYQYLMRMLHKTILFKDVKFKQGAYVTGFQNDHGAHATVNDEQVHSGADALVVGKWCLNSKREGGLDEYSYGRTPNQNRRWGRGDCGGRHNYKPGITSIIAEGDYWGPEETVFKKPWVKQMFSKSAHPNQHDDQAFSRIARAGLFNPASAPTRMSQAIVLLKHDNFKTQEFLDEVDERLEEEQITTNVNRGGTGAQNTELLLMMCGDLADRLNDDMEGEEATMEFEVMDQLQAVIMKNFQYDPKWHRTNAQPINWTRWMDKWRYTGVNLNGLYFNPKHQELYLHYGAGGDWGEGGENAPIPPMRHTSGLGYYLHDGNLFSIHTKPQLLTVAERHGIYAPKSWSKAKVLEAIIKGNRYSKNGYVPHGFKAIA
tara:strand:+ start:238 stop:1533 length:1296 start_codon:yes stop_codon:yes gene_type:complete